MQVDRYHADQQVPFPTGLGKPAMKPDSALRQLDLLRSCSGNPNVSINSSTHGKYSNCDDLLGKAQPNY
jgi:hypothetical protein